MYSTEDWTSISRGLWSGTSPPRDDIYRFQPSSRLVRFEGFPRLQESDESRFIQIPLRNPSKPKQYDCGWVGCAKADLLRSIEDWKLHMKDHARTARDSWKPSEPCCWHGCSSKARPRTAKMFEDHLNNIHVNPLLCTFEGCRHRTPL